MTFQLTSRPLLGIALTSSLLFAACARSAIEPVDEDATFAIADGGDGPDTDAEPDAEDDQEDAGATPDTDASSPPADAGVPAPDAAADAGSMDSAAASEAGAADAGGAADAALDAARDAAAPDAARDAAPIDAAPPVDTAPPAPKCTAGNYRGVFMGTVIVELFGIPFYEIQLTGNISLTAVAESGTDRFTVTNGAVSGQDNSGSPITAVVTGNLNCATGKVENGRLSDGKYLHALLGEITFDGNVAGTYTNTPPYANGTWQTETASTTLLKSAMGTWNVSLVP